ncbi:hypothetical protein [Streptomyces sp. HNM1019]|uniref:hypothetical protein n=1 Tax=Streptomyces sp. HNM1019 TaxID=3424717 RepID=UPI003D7854C5
MPEANDFPDMSKTLYNSLNALTRSGDITRLGRGLYIAPRLQQSAGQGPIPEQSPAAGDVSKEEYNSDQWPRPSAA